MEHKQWNYYGIAMDMQSDDIALEEFVNCLINNHELLVSDGELFSSESLLRRMKLKEAKRNKRIEAGKKAARSRWIKPYNANVNVHRFYQENFGIETPFIKEDIGYWINDLSKEVVILALQKAIEKNAEYVYAEGILKQGAKKEINTLDAANAESLSKARKKLL